MLKKISWGILLILIALCLYYWNWLSYGYNQAKGQLKVITQSRPIEDFLQDPNFPDSLKQKLELTMAVRGFAVDSLGLNKSDNYTELYDQKGKTLLWNVSASEPYALKAYTWQYPFLGEMPYKGFFDLEKAKREADLLKEKGLDVRIRTVGGWSTLGILKDPLLSNMLERNDGALAEVIIHELTHATLFVKNEVEFNENLASFIGEKGAERFLVSHFGDNSAQHLEYLQSLADSKTLTRIILKGAGRLDSLYGSFTDSLSHSLKDSLKNNCIQHIADDLKNGAFYNTRYQNIFDDVLPNNAYFMAHRRYHNQEDSIQAIFHQYNDDIKLMLTAMKIKYGK